MAKKEEKTVQTQVQEQVAETAVAPATTGSKAMNPVDIFRDSLMKTKREGMIDLLDFIQSIGFLDAPCSGGNHLAKKGGLLEHSVNVLKYAEKIGVSLLGGAEYNKVQDSVVIAALLHDLGKCGDYDKPMYVDNVLKSGKPSETKPFKRNPDLLAVPHAVRSIKLATLFIDLTEDEEWAILCHDGLYDFMKYDLKGKETWLQLIVHWADMWASRIIEGGSDKEGAE